ncbi:hypothetical protein EDI_095680 [Entamoeba dispar SAW760]|uniref:Uncharacterized protein n=1 Tax=Entamoeba dispar (strain ATCC PRA-260 / SAW760) TaxID=370354 RepID=B0E7J9_ENTDS|nr:uncharacterized protein EDI_095680 [Entamoeba dispar SAW760]EDR29501.1 hypothetical protein EDI_095680 [Entamoeba dispar SAW760]|eukprot:EDR29501.1 hypothetical protein EDI_095680 [Entamoeba dispar SAW760]
MTDIQNRPSAPIIPDPQEQYYTGQVPSQYELEIEPYEAPPQYPYQPFSSNLNYAPCVDEEADSNIELPKKKGLSSSSSEEMKKPQRGSSKKSNSYLLMIIIADKLLFILWVATLTTFILIDKLRHDN